jgi:hypothetical protein
MGVNALVDALWRRRASDGHAGHDGDLFFGAVAMPQLSKHDVSGIRTSASLD